MLKKVFMCFVALLAIAAAATGPARAQNANPDVTLDFTYNGWNLPAGKSNMTYAANSYTSGGYTITLQGGGSSSNGYYFNSDYLLLGKTDAYLQLPAFGSPVEKIEVVGNNGASSQVTQNVFVDENNSWVAVSTQTTGAGGTNTYVINENYRAAGNIYFIKVGSNHNTQITYIKVYYVSSGGGSTPEPPTPGQNGNLLTTITPTSLTTYDETTPGVVNVIFDGQLEYYENDGWQALYGDGNQGSVTVTAKPGFSIDSCKFYGDEDSYTVTAAPFAVYPYCSGSLHKVYSQPNAQGIELWNGGVKRIEVYGSAVPQPHTVRFADGNDGWQVQDVTASASATAPAVLQNVMAGDSLVVTAPTTLDRKVKSVKAVKYVAPVEPVATLQTLTVAKGNTELSGNKELYYMPGDTYRQALERTENQSGDGLGWGVWESGSLTTIFFKEVSNKAWDMAIDGDSNFASGQGSSTITLDTPIDPTNHTFQFVDSQ